MTDSTVFEKTYAHYLDQIAEIDFKAVQDQLLIKVEGGRAVVPLFGHPFYVSRDNIKDPSGKQPDLGICVLLCRYLIMCPPADPGENDWVSFRDFKDTGPLVTFFENEVQKAIADFFSGNPDGLKVAGEQLGGYSPDMEAAYDFSMQFDALPRLPLLLLFNDSDEEFPPQCSVLYHKSAESYLDGECLAILGHLLGRFLTKPPVY